MAGLIAHALLKQEEEPSPRMERLGIAQVFGILDRARSRWVLSGGEEMGDSIEKQATNG